MDSDDSPVPKKRQRLSRFFEVEAESGSSEESEAGEEPRENLPQITYPTRKRKSKFLERSAEDLADEFNRRSMYVSAETSAQEQMLPSTGDPQLWIVTCKAGKEKEAVINLQRKANATQHDPLPIFSIFASSHIKGYIYIEAYKKVHVVESIRGSSHLNSYKVDLVPVSEMADVFLMDKVVSKNLIPGSFVRMTAGAYKGDLAQVVEVSEQAGTALVKLVPRLDKVQHKKTRPIPRLFNHTDYPQAVRKRDLHTGEIYYQLNNMSFFNGLLLKTASIRRLQTDNVAPKSIELTNFQLNNQDIGELMTVPKEMKFVKGDKVKVVGGDLKGITGTVVSAAKESVTIHPDLPDLSENVLDFPYKDLAKVFGSGDHVIVCSGRFEDVTGIVVSSRENNTEILCDVSKDVVSVITSELKLTADISAGGSSELRIKVNDIVTLNNSHSFGLVTKVDATSLECIMHDGNIKNVVISEILRRFPSHKSMSTDGKGNSMQWKDMVKVTAKNHPLCDKIGAIKNSLRGFLFVWFSDLRKIVPVRARATELCGGGQSETAADQKLVGQIVVLKNGPYKGSTGKVTKFFDRRARVELMNSNKILTLEPEALEVVDTPADGMKLKRSPKYHATPTHDMMSPWKETPWNN